MDRAAKNRAMNEDAKRLAKELRASEEGSWLRLSDYALARFGDTAEVIALITVAYEIGHTDGESEREMYPPDED